MKLIQKTEVQRPTIWGGLLIFLLLAALGTALVFGLYPFLAQNAPLPRTELIIIEGWLEDAQLVAVLSDVESNMLFVATGGPIKFGASLLEEATYAEATAARLLKLGVSPQRIVTAPAPDTATDRTYVAALAARRALEEQGFFGRPANLYTLGAHSRRSFLLYRLVFGPEAPLGVVALECEQHNLRRWWKNSLAFKHVMTELASWIYVQCTRWKY